MEEKIFNVLFACTGNSVRSVMAEKLLEHWGGGRFRVYSAGSHPTGYVHPLAIQILTLRGLSTEGLRSKSWDEFLSADAPKLDFVFTVCDQAAKEVCPAWPGTPLVAHWGVEDPTLVDGSDEDKLIAFRNVCSYLENRIKLFAALPIDKLDHLLLQAELNRIGSVQA